MNQEGYSKIFAYKNSANSIFAKFRHISIFFYSTTNKPIFFPKTHQFQKFSPISFRAREDLVRNGKRFSSASSSTDEGCCSVEGDLEELPSGDELREAQLKLEEHRLGLDHDINQRIDSQIINRRLSDYQQRHFEGAIFGFNNGSHAGSSSSEVFESSFDSGCPPDYAASSGFTSSLPSCTPPPPKSPSPVLSSRVSRVPQARRASDAGPRFFYSQTVEDRPVKQRSIQGFYSLLKTNFASIS